MGDYFFDQYGSMWQTCPPDDPEDFEDAIETAVATAVWA